MDHCFELEPPDLSLQLPRDIYYQAIHTLCGSLPPPLTDSPDDRARRDNSAMAEVASLLPANAEEARLAALYAAAGARAIDCLRQAQEHRADLPLAMRCTAQSACMMREARGMRSLLLRVQAVRRKLEADSQAVDKAAWAEHCVLGLMADALGRRIVPPPEPPPPPAPPPEPGAADDFATLSEADQYAVIHPHRAALIRSSGGLPRNCDFGPPEPELVEAIVTGTTAILRALDPRPQPATG